ncbi:MAG: substrate-binding domain-containing protein [Clostridiales bacterium]|nr:substrate-binding domain-containing protein [Clostridiales bacterium]
MKKILALLLVSLMIFSLTACGVKTEGAGKTSAPTSNAASADPGSVNNPSANANAIGFFTDGVDPNSRDTYNIVFAYMRPMALFLNIRDALTLLEPVFNVKITDYCANSDIDAMIQNIEIYADQGVDGFIIVIDASANLRIKEVLDGTGLPYIDILNSVRDEEGSAIVHCIGMEGVSVGKEMTKWLFDNSKDYWGEIDTSKLGLLNFTFSPNEDFQDRYDGNLAMFQELVPGNTNIFEADGVTGGLNEETGYNLASAILSTHPEVEYWIIPACLELYAQGAMRAAETLGMQDRVLISSVNSEVLTALWDTGYEGCWVSCVASAPFQYAAPALSGIVSLLNGTETVESLWSSIRKPTDQLTFYEIGTEIVTKDTYVDYFDYVRRESGLS